jgi:hypothetical protein
MGIFKKEPSRARGRSSGDASGIRATSAANQRLTGSAIQISSDVFTSYPQPAQAVAFNSPRPLTASAVQLKVGDRSEAQMFRERRSSVSSLWQSEAWEYYDAIGEIKYAFNLVSSIVSRIKLYPALVLNPAEAPVPGKNVQDEAQLRLVQAAERAIKRLDSAYGGQAGLLRDAALNIQVTGECYLAQTPARIGHNTPESWDVRSVDEIVADQKGNYILTPRRDLKAGLAAGGTSKKGSIMLPKDAFVGRIWKSHPRFTDEADSSMKGVLDLCAELLLLNRTFRGTARSRLNAGALYLPDGLSVAANPDPNYPYDDADGIYDEPTPEELEDAFEDQLIDAMTTPIKDEDSASAVVPLIIRGPAELGDKIKQFKFERSFDPALAERSDRVLERIMQGLDVPKDIVTGLANVKYSNALQIDESLYKAHIEPLMLLIADALTVVYLRPYLLANGFTDAEVDNIVVWYDPSQVATRNDRAADADSGFEKMAISYETWRRAHGFAETEAPTPKEVALRLIFEKGAVTPELTAQIIESLAPEIMQKVREANQAQSVAPIPENLEQALNPSEEAPQPETPTEPSTPPAQEEAPQLAEPELPTETGENQ